MANPEDVTLALAGPAALIAADKLRGEQTRAEMAAISSQPPRTPMVFNLTWADLASRFVFCPPHLVDDIKRHHWTGSLASSNRMMSLHRSRPERVVLPSIKATGADLRGCLLYWVDLSGLECNLANLSGAFLKSVVLQGEFECVTFDGATLGRVVVEGDSHFVNCSFRSVHIEATHFKDVAFRVCAFQGAMIGPYARFEDVVFRSCDFRSADPSEIFVEPGSTLAFHHCDFTGCDESYVVAKNCGEIKFVDCIKPPKFERTGKEVEPLSDDED